MKKYLSLIAILALATSLASCSSFGKKHDDDHLTFPTLEPCSKRLLETNLSFICLKKQKGPDLIETNIKFNTDSFTLNNQAKDVLEKLYAYLN